MVPEDLTLVHSMPLNARASWLAGFPVCGDAILCIARINRGKGGVVWADLELPHLRHIWAELLPEARFARGWNAPLLCRLPTSFNPACWGSAPKPCELLSSTAKALCLKDPQYSLRQRTEGEDPGHVSSCTVTASSMSLAGLAFSATASAEDSGSSDEESLRCNAALELLHVLQEVAVDRLCPAGNGKPGEPSQLCTCKDASSLLAGENKVEILVEQAKGARQLQLESVMHISWRLFGEAVDWSDEQQGDKGHTSLAEGSNNLVAVLRTAMLAPQVERLLTELGGVGAVGRTSLAPPNVCKLHSPGAAFPTISLAAGHRLLVRSWGDPLPAQQQRQQGDGRCAAGQCVTLEAKVVYVKCLAQDIHGNLFSPSLAHQRYQYVQQLLVRFRPRVLVDVGCGEGALIEHIVASQAPGGDLSAGMCCVEAIVGVDVSLEVLQSAADAIRGTPHPRLQLHSPLGSAQEVLEPRGATGTIKVGLVLQDFTTASEASQVWADLIGCDLITMVEVIEHLDPEPLQAVAPVLLGLLRPAVCVVTTPNFEYNAVIEAITKRPRKHGGLRHPDHRFEWTRSEFQSWAEEAALQFGYTVMFEGLGRAGREPTVLAEMASAQGVASLSIGAASQAAVFQRLAPPDGHTEDRQRC